MSPRPKKASDEEVFAATSRVMQRSGPGQITLAEIAHEAGVTAGALVQRFGSKRELLLAVSERFAEGVGEMWSQMRGSAPSALAAVYMYADCMAEMGSSPGALANHLSYLQIDLTDDDFHRYARAQAMATERVLRAWVQEAMDAGDLQRNANAEQLARLVSTTVGGSIINWAFYREGTLRDWMRRDLDALLQPYRAVKRKRK